MAFDAGMLASVIYEINTLSGGARVEKVFQPGRDEIILQMRSIEGGKRLLINAGSSCARIGFTEVARENPQNPPMLCVLLRKHLNGARFVRAEQLGFERAVRLEFACRDEMGFPCVKYLIAETMGKYSNLIFADGDLRIISALKTVDFTTSSQRQVLPGMKYELPPSQGKLDPLAMSERDFAQLLENAMNSTPDLRADKLIVSSLAGISPVVAREVCFRATRHTDTPLSYCDRDELLRVLFDAVIEPIRTHSFEPCVVFDTDNGDRPCEYSFIRLTQYGGAIKMKDVPSPSAVLDAYFGQRDRDERIHQRAQDVLRLLTNAEARIRRKLELQRTELADCELGVEYKKQGDLITANLYMLKRGDGEVTLTDYSDYDEARGQYREVTVCLDTRLSPAQNAQRLYKKYAKSKTAKTELAKQISLAEAELQYISTVFDALSRAETVTDLAEIREELFTSGYASRMKTYTSHKSGAPQLTKYRTSGGYTVLCGRNNVQNEYLTHKLASGNDYWFHVKGMPGSHVVMLCADSGTEPSARDFTEACEIAAFNSKAQATQKIDVDYTLIRHLKKPPSSKPGMVIYHTYWSATVTPSAERVAAMRLTK